ncbi:MAG TPA: shikimate dehydrogenase, partial [Lysobacter sp.]|nr:shikimate dehydrogenase [Lysobacter sp.]
GLRLEGAHVLLLGAGGAAAGVAPALLDAGIASLAIRNRSEARTAALVERLGDMRVRAQAWDAATDSPSRNEEPAAVAAAGVDLVINTTSAARDDAGIDWPLPRERAPDWAAVDLGYGEAALPFLDAATARGAGVRIDGLGMLVEQAAESFALWHGVRPDTAPAYDMLRRALASR